MCEIKMYVISKDNDDKFALYSRKLNVFKVIPEMVKLWKMGFKPIVLRFDPKIWKMIHGRHLVWYDPKELYCVQ